jgi:hypothetical protein
MRSRVQARDEICGNKFDDVRAEVINIRGDSITRTITALRAGGFDWYANALDRTRNHDFWETYARTRNIPSALEHLSERKTPIPSIRECEKPLLVESARKSPCNPALTHRYSAPGHGRLRDTAINELPITQPQVGRMAFGSNYRASAKAACQAAHIILGRFESRALVLGSASRDKPWRASDSVDRSTCFPVSGFCHFPF